MTTPTDRLRQRVREYLNLREDENPGQLAYLSQVYCPAFARALEAVLVLTERYRKAEWVGHLTVANEIDNAIAQALGDEAHP